jgi:hypothetical protein
MRKTILIGTMILMSAAAAQAGETRSLSLAINNDTTATVAPRPVDTQRTAEVTVLPAPTPVATQPAVATVPTQAIAPAAVATAAPVASAVPAATQPSSVTPSRPRKSARAERSRPKRWTEARIIHELHRHGIYW